MTPIQSKSFQIVLFIGCALFGFFILPVHSQTTLGQSGTILTPSTETQPVGSFATGAYFRSVAFKNRRFDETPVLLTTGINANMEVGFSFPSVWGKPYPPPHFENHSLVSFKYRFRGESTDKWRLGISGLVQRSPISNDTAFRKTSEFGFNVLNSYAIGNGFQLHSSIGHFFTGRRSLNNRDNFSLGVERNIAPKVQFTADLVAVSNNALKRTISTSVITGVKYFWKPYIHFVAGGGVGVSKQTADWQYLLGVIITAHPTKLQLSDTRPMGLIFPLDPTDVGDQPLMETLKGIAPPPGDDEPAAKPAVLGRGGPIRTRLFFDRNSFQLNPFEKNLLSLHNKDVAKLPSGSPILVSGHSDPLGGTQDNRALSFARSLFVANQMVSEAKVSVGQLIIGGVGKEKLADTRNNPAVDQLNRWVELESNHRAIAFQELVKNGKNNGDGFAIEYQLQNSADSKIISELNGNLYQSLSKLGEVKPNQAIVLEMGYAKSGDFRLALVAASEQMVLLSQLSNLNAEQLYVRILPRDEVKVTKTSEFSILPKQWNIGESGEGQSLKVQLPAQKEKQTYTVQAVLVEKNRIVQSGGKILKSGQTPEPKLGKKWQTHQSQTFVFSFPMSQSERYQAYFLLYVFDKDGKPIQQLPLTHTALTKKWSVRFKQSVGLNAKEKTSALNIHTQLKKVTIE